MKQVLFHFSRSTGITEFLISIKNLWQYKKLPWDKFVKKKITFCKIFHGTQFFLELQNLADDLVHFSELSMFLNVSLH